MATASFAGIIEGFYGTPWTWDDRLEVCRFLSRFGADAYVYAPKSDPLHRDRWREPYERADLDGFARLVTDSGVRIGFAVSPGLSMEPAGADDRAALVAKFASLGAVGIDWFCLALDDIPATERAGNEHGELCAYLLDAIAPAELLFVPTDYTSIRSNAYLDGLATTAPREVAIGWTGPTVVTDSITANDARARAAALDGRAPWLWDNYPVNDGIMTERLFLGPLRGRDSALRETVVGYLANPMIQARASRLPIATAMSWWHGGDAEQTWRAVADELGWTTFARSCDAEHLRTLRGDALRAFLAEASECTAEGIDESAEPWLRQVHREARCAAALLAAERVEDRLMALARWTRLPDPSVSVFGPRRSMRPLLSQDDSVQFVLRPGTITPSDNAIDDLVLSVVNATSEESTGAVETEHR